MLFSFLFADAKQQQIGSFEPIYAKSKGVNQILKERGPRGGEVEQLTKEGETKTFAGKKRLAEKRETTGTAAKVELCEAETTDF
jgi:hypothetical protein